MINNEKSIRYFDNAATTHPKPDRVADAVYNAIKETGNPGRGTHPIAINAAKIVYEARERTANLFHCPDPLFCVFTSGATESLNIAIHGLITAEDHVITTMLEHNSVLRPLYKSGCELSFIPCDALGVPVYDGLEKMIKPNTKAIVATHISNVTGVCVDVGYLSEVCKNHGLYFILDAAQSAGTKDVDSSIASVTCFAGHKSLYGLQGTGGLIVNDAPVKSFKTGGSGHSSFMKEHPQALPGRLESGTMNCHGLAGLIAGLSFVEEIGLEALEAKGDMLLRRFLGGVRELKNIRVFGDYSQKSRGAVVSLLADGFDAGELSAILAEEYQIATRPGAHCAPLMHEHFKTEKSGLTRFSFSYFNTAEEIDYAVDALSRIK